MLIYVMLGIFLIATIITYILFEKDILQPAVIFSAMYTFSILCATINVESWGIDLSLKTFLIITLGGLEFIVISYLIFRKYKKKKIDENVEEPKVISIEKWKIIFLTIYSVIVLILLLWNVLSIASEYGEYSSFSEALTIFRQNTSYTANASLSRIVTLLLKPLIAADYICLFVFIKNVVNRKDKLSKAIFQQSIYLLPVIIDIIQNLIQSNRGSVIRIVVAAFVMFVIVWYEKNGWKVKVKLKTILILAIVAIMGLVAFYFTGTLVGRKISKNVVEYITMYCGGSIQCLNLYIEDPAEKNEIFGYETFTYLIRNLADYGIIELDEMPTGHLEWRKSNGINIGNVYTSYRRWIQDFGYIGMIILQAGVAIIYNIYYNKLKYMNKESTLHDIALIIYGYLSYCLFIHSIDSIFYLNVVRLYFVTLLITIILGYILLLKTNINFDNGLNVSIFNKELIKNGKVKKNE